jgi:hypothetical protein
MDASPRSNRACSFQASRLSEARLTFPDFLFYPELSLFRISLLSGIDSSVNCQLVVLCVPVLENCSLQICLALEVLYS